MVAVTAQGGGDHRLLAQLEFPAPGPCVGDTIQLEAGSKPAMDLRVIHRSWRSGEHLKGGPQLYCLVERDL
jgi:hypothetical protein